MINKKQKTKDEVEKTLNVLDNFEELEPAPFLYTRLKANMESTSALRKNVISLLKDKILPAVVLIILIVLNTVALTGYLKSREQNTNYRSEYVSAFAKQYSLGTQNKDYLTTMIKGE